MQEMMTELLELLINWHLSIGYSTSLFKRLIDQKYTLLPDILKTLARLTVIYHRLQLKTEFHTAFLSFVTCIIGNAQVRSIIYRSRVLQEYAEAFSVRNLYTYLSLQHQKRL
jgi:hypothetical protein